MKLLRNGRNAEPVASAIDGKALYARNIAIYWPIIAVALTVAFLFAQFIGGSTVDEHTHIIGLLDNISFARQLLLNGTGADFREIAADLEFYGILPIAPAYFTASTITWLFGVEGTRQFLLMILLLHVSAFAWGVGTCLLLRRLVLTLTHDQFLASLAMIFLLAYPTWLGHSFFNYKDLPLAFFFLLATIGAVGAQSRKPEMFRWGLVALSAATVGAGTVKLVGAPMLAAQWCAAFYAALRYGDQVARLSLLVLAGVSACVFISVLTPAAWGNPVEFALEALSYMGKHTWPGCMMTAGECMTPASKDWSTFSYLRHWLSVRLPISVLLILPLAVFYVTYKGKTNSRFVVISLFIPLLLIIVNNSTLYDGIRHILFLLPLAVALIFVFISSVRSSHPRIFKVTSSIVIANIALFLIDDVILYPYNYVYFNEFSRNQARQTQYDLDYWGFSLKQSLDALQGVAVQEKGRWRGNFPSSGVPMHATKRVVYSSPQWTQMRAYESGGLDFVAPDDIKKEKSYYWIESTRLNRKIPSNCKLIYEVTRRFLFTRRDMRLSYLSYCTNE